MFADDTTVLASHKNYHSLTHMLNSELTKISSWFKCNKSSLNISKTNFMHFQTTHSNTSSKINYDIKIEGLPLDKKDYTKFLGVNIDKYLSWNYHIANTSSYLARGIGILYRVKHILPQKYLIMLYNTLLLPYITYCNLIWGNCISKLNNNFLLQKKAIRICTNSSFLTHTDPLFYKLNDLKVDYINTFQTATFMFRYTKKLATSSIQRFFFHTTKTFIHIQHVPEITFT